MIPDESMSTCGLIDPHSAYMNVILNQLCNCKVLNKACASWIYLWPVVSTLKKELKRCVVGFYFVCFSLDGGLIMVV